MAEVLSLTTDNAQATGHIPGQLGPIVPSSPLRGTGFWYKAIPSSVQGAVKL